MRYAPAVVVLLALVIGSAAYAAGSNPHVTFPLHARPTSGGCPQFAPVNCLPLPGGVRPTVNVDASTDYVVYILVMNYAVLTGMQTAYDWDTSWVLNDVLVNCRTGQVNATTPDPSLPGGGTTGALTSAFNAVNGPALVAVGRLSFTSGTAGCLFQVKPDYPFGAHVTGVNGNDVDQINNDNPDESAARLGKICVTAGGTDTCNEWIAAVEPATWGSIKASFQ